MEPGLEGNRPGRLNSPTILGHTRRELRYALYPVLLLPTVGIKKGLDTLRRSGGLRRILHLHR
jgi:hypothetical protein